MSVGGRAHSAELVRWDCRRRTATGAGAWPGSRLPAPGPGRGGWPGPPHMHPAAVHGPDEQRCFPVPRAALGGRCIDQCTRVRTLTRCWSGPVAIDKNPRGAIWRAPAASRTAGGRWAPPGWDLGWHPPITCAQLSARQDCLASGRGDVRPDPLEGRPWEQSGVCNITDSSVSCTACTWAWRRTWRSP